MSSEGSIYTEDSQTINDEHSEYTIDDEDEEEEYGDEDAQFVDEEEKLHYEIKALRNTAIPLSMKIKPSVRIKEIYGRNKNLLFWDELSRKIKTYEHDFDMQVGMEKVKQARTTWRDF